MIAAVNATEQSSLRQQRRTIASALRCELPPVRCRGIVLVWKRYGILATKSDIKLFLSLSFAYIVLTSTQCGANGASEGPNIS
jgi:hypothetical protein